MGQGSCRAQERDVRGSNQDTGWVEQSLGGPKGGAHVEEEPGLGSLGGGAPAPAKALQP